MNIDPSSYRQRIRFIIKLGRALHECGASSDRIESHLINTTQMLGINGSFLSSPTTFTCAFWLDDELDQSIHIERLDAPGLNLGRLWEIDRLIESMEEGRCDFSAGIDRLEIISSSPAHYSIFSHALCWPLTGAAFAALLSSNSLNSIAAAVISLLLFAITHFTSKAPHWRPILPILAAFLAGASAMVLSAAGMFIDPLFVILSSIIIFIPGLSLTVALTEISTSHLISGSSRLVDAAMTMLKLFFGALSGVAVVSFFVSPAPSTLWSLPPLPDWRIWPALAVLSLGLCIAFNIPGRKIPWGLLAGAIAFGAARLGETHFGMYAGMFIGALAIGLFSNLFARITRGPGSILMTLGIILLVPGSRIYSLLNHWVSGEDILPHISGGKALIGFIALIAGLLFSNALLPARKSL